MNSRSLILALLLCGATHLFVRAQDANEGFEKRSGSSVTVAELLAHPDLWVLDAEIKLPRMLRTEVTDPQTGRKSRELVWYMVYRLTNRDLGRLEDSSDTTPINPDDRAPELRFSPTFTLVTTDSDNRKQYVDEILPQVQRQIERRERIKLNNAYEISGKLPELVTKDETTPRDKQIYGVAIWRNVDPRTDYFSVYISGLSNGYRLTVGPDGEQMVESKAVVQDFWRPGDRFEQEETEIRFQGEPRWIYRPTTVKLDKPVTIQVGTPVEKAEADEAPAEEVFN